MDGRRRRRRRRSKLHLFATIAACVLIVAALVGGLLYWRHSQALVAAAAIPEGDTYGGLATATYSGRAGANYMGAAGAGPAGKTESYLNASPMELAALVPPPPQDAAVEESDRKAFEKTRSLEGSKRWQMAETDKKLSPKSLMKAFSCASGVALSPRRAPQLMSLIRVAEADATRVAVQTKKRFPRTRPFVLYKGPTCTGRDDINESADYPSGHSVRGWTFALIMANLMPDRRDELRTRAEAYAESRVICGFHSPTGVEGGRKVAVITFNAMLQNPAFRDKMRQTAQELSRLRQQGQSPPPAQCASEDALITKS